MKVISGWVGTEQELGSVLDMFKVDTDDDGRYVLDGDSITVCDGEELMVSSGAMCFIQGKPSQLCALLAQTTVGLPLTIIQ